MKIERMPEPIDALVMRDTFSETEKRNILGEVERLIAHSTESEIWLNDVYNELDASSVHRNTMEVFFSSVVVQHLMEVNSLYGTYAHVNNHSTAIRYLGHEQMTGMHFDSSAFTIMTFLHTDPKNFDGGNVTLQVGGDIAYELDIENNMSIIYPSSYYVGLSNVEIQDKEIPNSGLYTINSFLFIEAR